jgi:hypothetical protein
MFDAHMQSIFFSIVGVDGAVGREVFWVEVGRTVYFYFGGETVWGGCYM